MINKGQILWMLIVVVLGGGLSVFQDTSASETLSSLFRSRDHLLDRKANLESTVDQLTRQIEELQRQIDVANRDIRDTERALYDVENAIHHTQ